MGYDQKGLPVFPVARGTSDRCEVTEEGAYKRWLPPLVVDGTTMPPGFVLAWCNRRRQDEKGREQIELQAWEGEGGNPASRNVALQVSLSAEAPGGWRRLEEIGRIRRSRRT